MHLVKILLTVKGNFFGYVCLKLMSGEEWDIYISSHISHNRRRRKAQTKKKEGGEKIVCTVTKSRQQTKKYAYIRLSMLLLYMMMCVCVCVRESGVDNQQHYSKIYHPTVSSPT